MSNETKKSSDTRKDIEIWVTSSIQYSLANNQIPFISTLTTVPVPTERQALHQTPAVVCWSQLKPVTYFIVQFSGNY